MLTLYRNFQLMGKQETPQLVTINNRDYNYQYVNNSTQINFIAGQGVLFTFPPQEGQTNHFIGDIYLDFQTPATGTIEVYSIMNQRFDVYTITNQRTFELKDFLGTQIKLNFAHNNVGVRWNGLALTQN